MIRSKWESNEMFVMSCHVMLSYAMLCYEVRKQNKDTVHVQPFRVLVNSERKGQVNRIF